LRDVGDPLARPRGLPDLPGVCRLPRPKLVAISSVKNEIDIVEAFVRHTLSIVDHLVVADNGSTDGTLEVLRLLAEEGLPLSVKEDPAAGKHLSQRMSRLMREEAVQRHQADWVVPLDADEFLVVPSGTPLIPDGTGADVTVSLPWQTYVPDSTDDPAKLNPVLRIGHRVLREGYPFIKVLVPRKLAEDPAAVLAQGSHILLIGGTPCETVSAGGPFLAHFPIRGPGQYLAKVAISAFQYHTMGMQAAGLAFHWRAPFELLKRDPEAFAASIFDDARRFSVPRETEFQPETVVDRLSYRGGPLLYTPMVDDRNRGWQAVLAYAEQLAGRYAALTTDLTADERISLEQVITAFLKSGQALGRAEPLLVTFQRDLKSHLAMRDELEECRHNVAQLAAQLERAARDVRALRRSWTWRVGAVVVRPTSRAVRWIKTWPRGFTRFRNTG
jgi:glycosyltransferase involved in cell wall biosynthesis